LEPKGGRFRKPGCAGIAWIVPNVKYIIDYLLVNNKILERLLGEIRPKPQALMVNKLGGRAH